MPNAAKTSPREAPVPTSAAAIVDLLNSRAYAIHQDKLDDPARAHALLAPFGQDDGKIQPARLNLVRALRADLMALVDGETAPAAWAAFSRTAAAAAFRHEFTGPAEVNPHQTTGDPVAGSIVLAVAELVANDTWSRLHACANDVCQMVFYDTTRSRTRRWHSYEICGNRANVAAYRSRTTG